MVFRRTLGWTKLQTSLITWFWQNDQAQQDKVTLCNILKSCMLQSLFIIFTSLYSDLWFRWFQFYIMGWVLFLLLLAYIISIYVCCLSLALIILPLSLFSDLVEFVSVLLQWSRHKGLTLIFVFNYNMFILEPHCI